MNHPANGDILSPVTTSNNLQSSAVLGVCIHASVRSTLDLTAASGAGT